MPGKIQRVGSALARPALVPMLMLAGSAIAGPALAADVTGRTVQHSEADSGYWTEERMRTAKPQKMPTVPGKPKNGSTASSPNGPTGGLPGRAPEVQPDRQEGQK